MSAVLALPFGERLELKVVEGARRHCLGGRPVAVGDAVELLLDGGRWLAGRYDWNGLPARWPGLRVELGGPWEGASLPRTLLLTLHPEARLRWAVGGR